MKKLKNLIVVAALGTASTTAIAQEKFIGTTEKNDTVFFSTQNGKFMVDSISYQGMRAPVGQNLINKERSAQTSEFFTNVNDTAKHESHFRLNTVTLEFDTNNMTTAGTLQQSLSVFNEALNQRTPLSAKKTTQFTIQKHREKQTQTKF